MIDRDKLQDEMAEAAFIAKRGIIKAAMRFGKCKVGVKILQKLPLDARVFITYPETPIKSSWTDEFEKMGYNNSNVVFSTNMSIHKHKNEKFDIVLVDEAQKLSERNIADLQELILSSFSAPNFAYFLSGSLPPHLIDRLCTAFKMRLESIYEQEDAIADGIISDYRINVIKVPLDNQRLIQYKGKKRTEKQQFNAYSHIINKLQQEGRETFYMRLARMRVIQGSVAKMEQTRKLLKEFRGEKVLVFCGLIKIAEQLGIPVEHSKSKENNIKRFQNGEIHQLAVCKMGQSGVTFSGLNKIIINFFDSSEITLQQRIGRAMNLDWARKTAEIYIISSTESAELAWLNKALAPFSKEKINYL